MLFWTEFNGFIVPEMKLKVHYLHYSKWQQDLLRILNCAFSNAMKRNEIILYDRFFLIFYKYLSVRIKKHTHTRKPPLSEQNHLCRQKEGKNPAIVNSVTAYKK